MKLIDVTFQPYLIPQYFEDDGEYGKPFKITREIYDEFYKKRGMKTKMKKLTERALYDFKLKKYKFDEDELLIHTTLEWTQFEIDNEKTSKEQILETLKDYYGDKKELIGNAAPDLWLSGNQVIYEDKDVSYEFGISTRNVEFKDVKKSSFSKKKLTGDIQKKTSPKRKSPLESATTYMIGKIKKGNDGEDWVVKRSGKSQRWYRTYGVI